jgi:TRAP-type mannitol/chloroaromatic compound transport system permease small subunit
MQALERFRRLVNRASYGACFLGMFLAIPLMLLTVGDVMGRSFFNKPIPGAFELSEYMLAVIVLLGAAYTQQVKGHVGVDFLTSRYSPRTQAVFQAVTTLAGLLIIAILVWQGYLEGIHEKAVSDQLRVPQWPFKLLVAVGGLLLWLELLLDLIASVLKIAGRT